MRPSSTKVKEPGVKNGPGYAPNIRCSRMREDRHLINGLNTHRGMLTVRPVGNRSPPLPRFKILTGNL